MIICHKSHSKEILSINSLCIYFVCSHNKHTECMLHESRRLLKFFAPLLCLQCSKWCLTHNRSPINTFERIFQNIEIFISKIFSAVKKSSNKWAGEVRETFMRRWGNQVLWESSITILNLVSMEMTSLFS